MEEVTIFSYRNEDHEELKFDVYSITPEWNEKINIVDNLERFGISEDDYTVDIQKSIYSPENFCKNLFICFETSEISLYKNNNEREINTISQEINKDTLLKQLQGMAQLYFNLLEKEIFSENIYINCFNYSVANFALLNVINNSEIFNKYYAFGTGNKEEQIVPHYILQDIIDNDEKYEIFLFDDCEDEAFGCPLNVAIYKYLNSKLEKSKIANIKIYHIKNNIEILSIWYFLQNNFLPKSQYILCDTIGSGHNLKKTIDEYNVKLHTLDIATLNNFSEKILKTNTIVSYFCTGQKIIFFSPEHNKFVGHRTIDYFLLSELSYDIIKNNRIEKNYNLHEVGEDTSYYEKKYIKYKSKYIKLKSILAK